MSGLLTVALSDGTEISRFVEAKGAPQFFGWVNDSPGDVGITSFKISGAEGGLLVGNFIVPEAESTAILLSLGFATLVLLRRRLSSRYS